MATCFTAAAAGSVTVSVHVDDDAWVWLNGEYIGHANLKDNNRTGTNFTANVESGINNISVIAYNDVNQAGFIASVRDSSGTVLVSVTVNSTGNLTCPPPNCTLAGQAPFVFGYRNLSAYGQSGFPDAEAQWVFNDANAPVWAAVTNFTIANCFLVPFVTPLSVTTWVDDGAEIFLNGVSLGKFGPAVYHSAVVVSTI
ncbi:hypothetical protein GPECTOR_99g819 [Gonium pectorale]|uniref:Uncharacterized protein n=1 Tax=Gonium pectorale TaxID=33097 RepID=A0A150G018_GONPE|nr:hypothetical protein GPECTOR_99g819 [Gonium pectorale]|eukprot:KXZ43184.1 hypothetical protein GPECTOR_99g819 [Gonium pectorale]